MSRVIDQIEQQQLKQDVPDFAPGDTVVVQVRVTEGDRERLQRGFRFIRRFFGTAPARELVEAELAPGSAAQSDEQIDAWLRSSLISAGHPTSTCAMGSVVDSELRVAGVAALRVADASVMPRIVRGNTHAPTVMIAEKAADLLAGTRNAKA